MSISRKLPQVTLVSIITDDKWIEPCLKAEAICRRSIEFGASKLIGPPSSVGPDLCATYGNIGPSICAKYANVGPTYHVGHITWPTYSPWILKNLTNYIDTDYCLIYQYDGFVINPELWSDDFLTVDYIGAIWTNVRQRNRVGNGGFSLRSKKFLDLCCNLPEKDGLHTGEDWIACVSNYDYMKSNGIEFAPIWMATDFSVEHPMMEKSYIKGDLSTYRSFGFHDKTNTGAMALLGSDY